MPWNIKKNSVGFILPRFSRIFRLTQLHSKKEYAAMLSNKGRRESSGSDRLGELHTTVGAHFDAEEYQRNAAK